MLRIPGAQVVECDPMLGVVRIVPVDVLYLEQREIALALFGRSNLAEDGVTGAQIEALDLGGADIDIVRAVEVVPVL